MESAPPEGQGQHSCTVCHQPAKLSCAACKYDSNGEARPTWYCGKECQKQDRINHKPRCDQARYVEPFRRAVEFVQKAFFIVRKEGFDVLLERVKVEGKVMTLYQGKAGDRVLFEFLKKLMVSKEMEEAVLSYCASDDAIGRFHTLVQASIRRYDVRPADCNVH
jgi:hypothetical protein